MANTQQLEVYAGEDRTLTLYARDASNLPVNLTGKTITVYIGRKPTDPDRDQAILTKTGTIVSASAGSFSIAIAASDTANLTTGDWQYNAQTSSGGSTAVVTRGRFRINPVVTS